jgi:hypothetical protein
LKPLPELVFVQLGVAPCEHLWANLRHTSEILPHVSITVIVDQDSLANAPLSSGWNYWTYERKEEIKIIVGEKSQDKNFRDGFWSYTLERLFAFLQYHQIFPEKKLIHVESDILLFPDFPVEKFMSIGKLAWLRVDHERDVAALIYSPSGSDAKFLEAEIISELNKSGHTTDMHVLFQIREKNPERVEVLPSLEADSHFMATENVKLDSQLINQLSANYSIFGGVFDPVALGIWLTGTDPRNSYGQTMYSATEFILKNGSFVNPAAGQFSYSEKQGLVLKRMETEVRIWNLHIHSKDMRIFANSWESYLNELISKSAKKKSYTKRSIKVLVGLLRHNVKNKTLVRFTAAHPIFRPIMTIYRKFKG